MICEFDDGEYETDDVDTLAEMEPGDLIGSCEANCYDICNDNDNLCTDDVNVERTLGTNECKCNKPTIPVAVAPGEKCCPETGVVLPQDACCPTGQVECCGQSIGDCLSTLNPYQANVTERALGVPPPGTDVAPISLFSITDVAMIEATEGAPGVYTASTTYGQEFSFEILAVLQNSSVFNETFFDPAVSQELVDYFQEVDGSLTDIQTVLNKTDVSPEFVDFVATLEFNGEYSALVTGVLLEPTQDEEKQVSVEKASKAFAFLGRFEGQTDSTDDIFLATVETYTDPAGVRVGLMVIVAQPSTETLAQAAIVDGAGGRRLNILPSSCTEAFNQAETAADLACKDGKEFESLAPCKATIIGICEGKIQDAKNAYDSAVETAEERKRELEFLADLWKANAYRKCFNKRGCFLLRVPKAIAICAAGCVAAVEIRTFLKKQAAKEAFELAKQLALENWLSLARAALFLLKETAKACFKCECPDGQCCPACTGSETCCSEIPSGIEGGGGTCLGEDQCCPGKSCVCPAYPHTFVSL